MNYDNLTRDDDKIVEMYWQRDELAIEYTRQKYGPLCYTISHNILSNTCDVEECMNDMYMATWNTIPPQKPNSLKMYLCKLIRRISINRVTYNNAEKRDRRKTISFEEIEIELQQNFVDDYFMDSGSYLTDIINDYLSQLPEKRRVLLVLRFWRCMSLCEISQRMGININTVKTILAREVHSMKKYFIKEGVYKDE